MTILTRDDFEARYPQRVPRATHLPFDRSVVLRGKLSIDTDTSLRGVINGDVEVRDGAQLSFHGVIKGSLIVDSGGTAYVNGVVKGDVRLAGGVMLEGVVKGNVRAQAGSAMHIEGVVKGRMLE